MLIDEKSNFTKNFIITEFQTTFPLMTSCQNLSDKLKMVKENG